MVIKIKSMSKAEALEEYLPHGFEIIHNDQLENHIFITAKKIKKSKNKKTNAYEMGF